MYVSYLKPLEWCCNKEEHNGTMHREDNVCYVKMICVLSEKEKVVGLHYLGPNAGEVMQVRASLSPVHSPRPAAHSFGVDESPTCERRS